MFKKSLIIVCLFFVWNGHTQEIDTKEKPNIPMPQSIYAAISESNYSFANSPLIADLQLEGYKFIFTTSNYNHMLNNIVLDIRNIGRISSFEDLQDNYQKKEINKYFFSGFDLRTIPWREN